MSPAISSVGSQRSQHRVPRDLKDLRWLMAATRNVSIKPRCLGQSCCLPDLLVSITESWFYPCWTAGEPLVTPLKKIKQQMTALNLCLEIKREATTPFPFL